MSSCTLSSDQSPESRIRGPWSVVRCPASVSGIKMHLGLTNAIERNKSVLVLGVGLFRAIQLLPQPMSSLGQHTLTNQAHTSTSTTTTTTTATATLASTRWLSGGLTVWWFGGLAWAYIFVKLLNIMAMECHSDAPNMRHNLAERLGS